MRRRVGIPNQPQYCLRINCNQLPTLCIEGKQYASSEAWLPTLTVHVSLSYCLTQMPPLPFLVSFSRCFQNKNTPTPAETGIYISLSKADGESRENLNSGLEVSQSHMEGTFNATPERPTLSFHKWRKWGPARICDSPEITGWLSSGAQVLSSPSVSWWASVGEITRYHHSCLGDMEPRGVVLISWVMLATPFEAGG